ncbi:hypothetical protein FNV43_RR21096 [Rhamnella rubrinervis]|uniref:Nucleotide-diphospho-sugar transferase domain-containing protein n=1 Tax=Rhamnella rubrinervis TaxID=2594499 RepID=A0A8K0E2F5_9ROSA|nr:hypothetical protein FNV43_RR21096 [Rhamnella rubrinervis]
MILEGELTSSFADKYFNGIEDEENGRESEGKWKKIGRKMMTKSLEVAEKGCNYNQQVVRIGMLFVAVAVACLVLSNSVPRTYVLSQVFSRNSGFVGIHRRNLSLDTILENAAMQDKTVIITNLNDAWAEPNSIFDLFLKSFEIGNNTQRLVNHLVVICLDEKAYNRCLTLHPHCYNLVTGNNSTREAFFMTPEYLEIVWRKIHIMATILEKGYNFVFTDTDIMWLRDPFPRFYPGIDFQSSCDSFFGNASDVNNLSNTGFSYVKSNNRTIQFYNFWYDSRRRYPRRHDQHVFDTIKYDPFTAKIGVQLRFHDTAYFGGFCNPSRDFNVVCTMHANCCVGLQNKIHDLQILLEDWRRFMSKDPTMQQNPHWSVPQKCRRGNSRKKNST